MPILSQSCGIAVRLEKSQQTHKTEDVNYCSKSLLTIAAGSSYSDGLGLHLYLLESQHGLLLGQDLGHGRHGRDGSRLSLGQDLGGEEPGKRSTGPGRRSSRSLWPGRWRETAGEMARVNPLGHQAGRQLLLGEGVGLT